MVRACNHAHILALDGRHTRIGESAMEQSPRSHRIELLKAS